MLIDIPSLDGDKRLFAFADTHGRHREVMIPNDIDLLVFAGDACEAGDEAQLQDFYRWFGEQPGRSKLFVPGNHDLPFDYIPEREAECLPEGVTYMDEGEVELEGLRFYVLPARPELSRETRDLPQGIDVLVTHGAPYGLLDENGRWGCPVLRAAVEAMRPRIHLFGHSHKDGGHILELGGTKYYNVAFA
jgi:predicted phosphodiesterase